MYFQNTTITHCNRFKTLSHEIILAFLGLSPKVPWNLSQGIRHDQRRSLVDSSYIMYVYYNGRNIYSVIPTRYVVLSDTFTAFH